MNDCSENNEIDVSEFGDNLTKLIKRLEQIDAIPVLQTTCPILPGQAPDTLRFTLDICMSSEQLRNRWR